MDNEVKGLREFGRFRLDPQRKVLWYGDHPVNLPLGGPGGHQIRIARKSLGQFIRQYLTVLTRRNVLLGERLSSCGRCSEAIPLLEEAKSEQEKRGNESARTNATLGYCYAVTSQTEKAREALRVLEEQRENGYSMFGRILIHASLGEIDIALKVLNESYQTGDVRLTRLKADPRFKVIHSERLFQEIMQKMNLTN